MKKLKMGDGSTVCSEASTGMSLGGFGSFARAPPLVSQYSDIFIPNKIEFKGCVTDYKQCSFQGLK